MTVRRPRRIVDAASVESLVRSAGTPGSSPDDRYVGPVIDVLADVMEANRTDGAVFARVRFRSPWALRCDAAPLAGFHIVARGSCAIRLDGDDDVVHLDAGDVSLVTQGQGHDLFDGPGARTTPLGELIEQIEPGTIGHLALGGDGAETILVCGGYLFREPGPHPVLSTLPPVLHVRHDRVDASMRRIVEELVREVATPRHGAKTVVNRLVDVLLIHLLRAWVDEQEPGSLGWLAGLRDPAVSVALQRIHHDYARRLTLTELAAECGLSLSTFKQRFRELVGEAPGSYLGRHRLETAARLLRDTDHAVGVVAAMVGYGSEYAFNRAFHRQHGLSPGRYRTHVRTEQAPSPLEAADPG